MAIAVMTEEEKRARTNTSDEGAQVIPGCSPCRRGHRHTHRHADTQYSTKTQTCPGMSASGDSGVLVYRRQAIYFWVWFQHACSIRAVSIEIRPPGSARHGRLPFASRPSPCSTPPTSVCLDPHRLHVPHSACHASSRPTRSTRTPASFVLVVLARPGSHPPHRSSRPASPRSGGGGGKPWTWAPRGRVVHTVGSHSLHADKLTSKGSVATSFGIRTAALFLCSSISGCGEKSYKITWPGQLQFSVLQSFRTSGPSCLRGDSNV